MNKSTEVLRVTIDGQPDIVVEHHMPNDTYTVKYGAEFKRYITLMMAIAAYESCVVHALSEAGFDA